MRTLSEVFAARGPLLPEGLRTLDVSPNRTIEPGMTVYAAFTFRNLGGGTASGFRVRFRLPEGLTYLVGTARIDETPLDELGGLTTLLQTSGADIGEIPAGGERRVSLAYTVATTIENGTPISLQAAIASFDVPVIGSNIVRLVVRSRPVLQNAKTTLALSPTREALPGEELQLSARVHNSGQSSAHDLIVLLPLPAHTTYVAHSVGIEGRAFNGTSEVEPFGFARPSVIAPTLGPGATVDIGYRVRIDSPLEDATPIVAQGAVCSQEVAEFAFAPVTIKIPSAALFAGDDTSLRVECDDEVEPGQRVRIVLRARNGGTARARKPTLKISLPEGIAFSSGSLSIDGLPVPDRGAQPDTLTIGDLEPGRSVEIGLTGVVRSPVADGVELRIAAAVVWSKGQRKFERIVTARSLPHFPPAFNKIERETSRRVGPADSVKYTVALQNMGSDSATDVRLQLHADDGLERLHVYDNDREVSISDDGVIPLDMLEPGSARELRIEAQIAAVIEDQTGLRLHAMLLTAQCPPVDLGAPVHTVASRPRFSAKTSHLALGSAEALRPNRLSTCRLVLVNEGTDRGRDVRVFLQPPDELRLERVEDATRDGNIVVFGDIPAGESREAMLSFRLVGTVGGGDVLSIAARAGGLNVVPFGLTTIELATHAEASFGEGATLVALPGETIDAGAEITYTLSLRNCGDGAAKRLVTRVAGVTNAVYAPGSTTLNGIALQDFAGTSPLLSAAGLTLADVGPGVEIIARWRVIVNLPLPPATAIETAAIVRWDESAEISIAALPVRVHSTSALPIIEPELPFSVLGAVAAPLRSGALAAHNTFVTLEPAYTELRPALPVGSNGGTSGVTPVMVPAIEYAQLPPANGATAAEPATTAVFLDLNDDELSWVVQYLEQTRIGGLVAHLLVLRALFPDRVTAADRAARNRLRAHRELLAGVADRLFIKVRLPDFPLEAADVETAELRSSLLELLGELTASGAERPAIRSGLRLLETLDIADLAARIAPLNTGELATAAPWHAMVQLIGTTLQLDGGPIADFSVYRNLLARELAARTHLDAIEFVASLRRPVGAELDAARESVIRVLAEQQRVLN